jgi:hypothetical protein
MEILIRFNTAYNLSAKKGSKESLKWRMLVNGVEHLIDEVEVNCPSKTQTSYVEGVGIEHHILIEVDSFEIVGKRSSIDTEIITAVLSKKKGSGNLGFDFALARQEYIQKEHDYEQSKKKEEEAQKQVSYDIGDNIILRNFYKTFKENKEKKEEKEIEEALKVKKLTTAELYKAEVARRRKAKKVEGEEEKPHWNIGRKHTEETLAKMRKPKAKKGIRRKKTKLPSANTGKVRTEETKEKMRKPKSEAHKESMRLGWEKRRKANLRKLKLLIKKNGL